MSVGFRLARLGTVREIGERTGKHTSYYVGSLQVVLSPGIELCKVWSAMHSRAKTHVLNARAPHTGIVGRIVVSLGEELGLGPAAELSHYSVNDWDILALDLS